jgi:hypothetical protein
LTREDGGVVVRVVVQPNAQGLGVDRKELASDFADDEEHVGSVDDLTKVISEKGLEGCRPTHMGKLDRQHDYLQVVERGLLDSNAGAVEDRSVTITERRVN